MTPASVLLVKLHVRALDVMTEHTLDGATVMVVEDEVIVGFDLAYSLEDHGATVAGPFSRLDDAFAYEEIDRLDAAILDVDLRGRTVFPLVSKLLASNVPILFHTARNGMTLDPSPIVALCPKPCKIELIVARVSELIEVRARHVRSARPALQRGPTNSLSAR